MPSHVVLFRDQGQAKENGDELPAFTRKGKELIAFDSVPYHKGLEIHYLRNVSKKFRAGEGVHKDRCLGKNP